MPEPEPKLPIQMNVSKRSNEALTAIACPACGAGAAFGQAGCAHCGSGLLENKTTDKGRFGIPLNSREWKVGEDFGERDRLRDIVKRMQEKTPEGQYSYVMWNDLPAIVGEEIDAETAIENFQKLGVQIKREKLGKKWTRALDDFRRLQVELGMMDDEVRLGLKKKYRGLFKDNALMDPETFVFFEEPTFENFETTTSYLEEVGDDADQLKHGIKTIRDLYAPNPEA